MPVRSELEMPDGGYVYLYSQAEYDALAAEVVELRGVMDQMARNHYTTLMAGQTRIRELEAALRDVLTFADIAKPVDADALTEKVRKAWQAVGATAETLVDLKDPHNAHHPDRLKGPGLTAPETGTKVPPDPSFCLYCGKPLPEGCSTEFEVETGCEGYYAHRKTKGEQS